MDLLYQLREAQRNPATTIPVIVVERTHHQVFRANLRRMLREEDGELLFHFILLSDDQVALPQ